MMNIKDVKPVSKTCIFFIQYVTLVTASNNELFSTISIMYSQMIFLSDTIDNDVLKSKSGAVMKYYHHNFTFVCQKCNSFKPPSNSLLTVPRRWF